jgi:hypothetical protein
MPRFFFHLYDDVIAQDEEGLDLPDVAAAREQALFSARALVAEQALLGSIKLRHRIEVEDENGRPVLVLPFRAAVEIEGGPELDDGPLRKEPTR